MAKPGNMIAGSPLANFNFYCLCYQWSWQHIFLLFSIWILTWFYFVNCKFGETIIWMSLCLRRSCRRFWPLHVSAGSPVFFWDLLGTCHLLGSFYLLSHFPHCISSVQSYVKLSREYWLWDSQKSIFAWSYSIFANTKSTWGFQSDLIWPSH